MKRPTKLSYVFIFAIVILSGIGLFLSKDAIADLQGLTRQQLRKFMSVVQLIQLYYVEPVDWDKEMEGAITGLLNKLDPHSVYIPAKKMKEVRENFNAKFEGIGIQFDVINGYLTVIAPIVGSPSDRLGIRSGDKIVKIDGKSAIGITREEVVKKLRGPKGTTVKVTIIREGVDEPLEFTIVRDEIPIYTVTTKFMVDDSTGYIKVNRFAATTSSEVEEALISLESQGMRRLILDLRNNPGGYLHEAVKLAGKFLPGHALVVYTKGRSGTVEDEYYADQFGRRKVRLYPLVILIDRGSASASEIVSGAIQDYDRGLIVGTTSFGKGLVQKEFPLSDGSAVRLTTAKYYIPSGRSIQRSYKGKSLQEYYQEAGEAEDDSLDNKENKPVFYTKGGRKVYGGGGIHPDIVEKESYWTYRMSKTTQKIYQKRLFFTFAADYVVKHPKVKTTLRRFNREFKVTDKMLADFKAYARKNGIDVNDKEFDKDRDFIALTLKAEIARDIWNNDGYYFVIMHGDQQFLKAYSSFELARQLAHGTFERK